MTFRTFCGFAGPVTMMTRFFQFLRSVPQLIQVYCLEEDDHILSRI